MKLFILVTTSLLSLSSFAWGPTGHRIVAQIAENHLGYFTKKRIEDLLDGESLARVSNWPDKIKSDPDNYGHTYRWHYTDWADTSKQYDKKNNSGDLVKAIEENFKILKNKKSPKKDRAFSLKFLVHLIGDLHQPLHVGNGLDRGGNRCRVLFHGKESNLHEIWDEKLIEFSRLSYTEYSKFLDIQDKHTNNELAKGNPLQWAKESVELRPELYPADASASLSSPKPYLRKYCNKKLNLSNEQLPKIGYKYGYKFIPMMEKRMLKAGVRLARLINEAL